MKKGGASLGSSIENQSRWRTAGELLKARRYEQVAQLLHEAQADSELAGDASLAHFLEAARRICLASSQCQADAEYHRRVCAEADQREHELRRHLHTILELISGHGPPETRGARGGPSPPPTVEMSLPERGLPAPAERLSLWQRIQALLGWGQGPRWRGREPPTALVDGSARPSAETVETLAASLLLPEREAATISPAEKETLGVRARPTLVAYCLGPFRVYQNDRLITAWDGLKGQCILKYLVTHGGRPVSKDILMDLLWRDANPKAARRNLHQAIYSLRQTLRRGHSDFQHIHFENDCYMLNSEMDIWLDSAEFEKHVQAGHRLETSGCLADAMTEYGIAEGLYQGDFLEEDLYEDWPKVQREHIRAAYLDIVDRLSEYCVQQSEHAAAIALCQKVLARDICHQEAHRRLMRCYLAQGQRHLAVRQYQACVQALKEELDLTPSEDTVALYRRITTA